MQMLNAHTIVSKYGRLCLTGCVYIMLHFLLTANIIVLHTSVHTYHCTVNNKYNKLIYYLSAIKCRQTLIMR